MNKYYNIEDDRKGNCTFFATRDELAAEGDGTVEGIIEFFARAVRFVCSEKFRAIARVIVSMLCFVGFVGIIGGVESETLSIGTGIVLSAFAVFIEILCFIPGRK